MVCETKDCDVFVITAKARGKGGGIQKVFVYYEYTKRELQRIHTYVCRCNERLKTKTEGSTHLGYTGLRGGLEHLTCPKDRNEVPR